MVKKGRKLKSEEIIGYRHPITDERMTKTNCWICEVCGVEYVFRGEAQNCEVKHYLEKNSPKLLTIAEAREKKRKEREARMKFIEDNRELERKEYQELKEMRDKALELEDLDKADLAHKKMMEHYKKWRL